MNESIPEGEIRIGSDAALTLGFTADRFSGYLWRTGDSIFVSLIISLEEGKGHVSGLFDRIASLGYTVKVPVPSVRMTAILRHKGFVRLDEWDPFFGETCEVWCKASEAAVPI